MTAMRESRAREMIAEHGRSLHQRGFVPGSSGNLSLRIADGVLVTPTNSCLGRLDPATISKLDLNGNHVAGDMPSKESFLHTQVYASRSSYEAVVHLHCTHAVAIACSADVSTGQPIQPLTPYYVMKIGKLQVVPYFPPGDRGLASAVAAAATRHHAILLANHGPVVAGSSLDSAVYAMEELEEAAKLQLLLHGHPVNPLSPEQTDALAARFAN